MKFKIKDKVRVVNPYSGGNFKDGDIVEIMQIGFEDEDCYGAISPHDGIMWFLNEDEVTSLVKTNADRIRNMTDEELSWFLWTFDVDKIACEEDFLITRKKLTEWLKGLTNI